MKQPTRTNQTITHTQHKHIMSPLLACLTILVSMLFAAPAMAQVYEIDWYTIDGGGAMYTFGGSYELSGTIGQYDASTGPLAGGSYELAGGFWAATAQPVCIADFNNDGSVNTLDMLAFLNAWTSGDSSADINGDGSVNTLDVLAFLNLWTAGCP